MFFGILLYTYCILFSISTKQVFCIFLVILQYVLVIALQSDYRPAFSLEEKVAFATQMPDEGLPQGSFALRLIYLLFACANSPHQSASLPASPPGRSLTVIFTATKQPTRGN